MRTRPRLAVLALALGAIGAAPAGAATYVQEACATADGRPVAAAGFTADAVGEAAAVDDTCRRGGGLLLAVDGSAGAASAAWRYVAPPGTSVAGAVIRRTVAIPGGSRAVYALAGSADRCDAAAGCGDDVFDLPVPAAGLALRLSCPQDGCGRPSSVVVRRLRITLRDDEPPAFAAAPAGGLVGAGPVRGLQTITFTATDRGGGVAAATLLVDGAPRAHVALGCHRPYTRPVPCPLRATGRLRLDTRGLRDGEHDIAVAVIDATGENRTVSTSVAVTVENHVPATRAPRPARPVRVVLRASRRRLHNGQALSLVAAVTGAPAARPHELAFQVRIAGRWRTFAFRRADAAGRARVRHRFRLTFRRLRYVFRAVAVAPGGGRASAPVAVVVLQ